MTPQPAYTRRIAHAGQPASIEPDPGLSTRIETYVGRVLALTDEEREAIAEARSRVDEAFHERALQAAAEALAGRGDEYLRARSSVVTAHVPDTLESAEGSEAERLNEVARRAQLAIDDGLLAVLTSAALHPNHLRELHRSVKPVFDC